MSLKELYLLGIVGFFVASATLLGLEISLLYYCEICPESASSAHVLMISECRLVKHLILFSCLLVFLFFLLFKRSISVHRNVKAVVNECNSGSSVSSGYLATSLNHLFIMTQAVT